MNELKFQSKIFEAYYANETFRYRFFHPGEITLNPVQKAYTSKVPANVINALLSRLHEAIACSYDLENIRDIGRILYRQLIPNELSEALYERGQAITVVSEDYSIPWELLHDSEDFLGSKHSMGRCLIWDLGSSPQAAAPKRKKSCLIISNPAGDLKEAEAETVILMDFLRRRGIACSYLARSQASPDEILLEMGSGNYDFIHYSGHITRDPKSGQYAFALADGNCLPAGSIGQLNIGRPFVFLNGCGTGRIDQSSTSGESAKGMIVPFLSAGASSVVGTLWRVSDSGARKFAESVYAMLLNGESIGEALLISRKKMQDMVSNDPAWTSFVLYGNPGLYLGSGESKSTIPENEGGCTGKPIEKINPGYLPEDSGVHGSGAPDAIKKDGKKNSTGRRWAIAALVVVLLAGIGAAAFKFFLDGTPDKDALNHMVAPVILPFDRQPLSIWEDGELTYSEIVDTDCKLAFTLPEGLGTGNSNEATGVDEGYVIYIEITDTQGKHLDKMPSPVSQLELDKEQAVVGLREHLFRKIKDGQAYNLHAYIEKDGHRISGYSRPVTFVFRDEPEKRLEVKELHIISTGIYDTDKELFKEYGQADFSFAIKPENSTRARALAWLKSMDAASQDFVLKADGRPDVPAKRSGYGMNARNRVNFAVAILEPEKLVKGVTYRLVPVNQNPDAQWVVDEGVVYTAK